MSNPKKPRPKRGKLAEMDLIARDNALKALELRKAGATYAQIAAQLQYADESGARKAVQTLMEKREYDSVDEARKIEIERLDKILLGNGNDGVLQQATKGHLGAIDRVLRIAERRAKLLGLDAPAKQDITSNGESIIPILKTGMDLDEL